MARLEVFGPPAVGKTTLLEAARALGGTEAWLTPDKTLELGKKGLGPDVLSRIAPVAFDGPEVRDLVQTSLGILSRSDFSPQGSLRALEMLREATALHLLDTNVVAGSQSTTRFAVIQDEGPLHRGTSICARSSDIEADARAYYSRVPIPDAAVALVAPARVVAERAEARHRQRGWEVNSYKDLSGSALQDVVERLLRMTEIAVEVLRERGVDVTVIDTAVPHAEAAGQLVDAVERLLTASPHREVADPSDDVKHKLRSATASFRKKTGRHQLRTKDVIYCSFSTPAFQVDPAEAQRNAAKRLARFGIDRAIAGDKTVLDLGTNAGAMLFEISNLGIASGLGFEYDAEKVDIAREIASLSALDHVSFHQGDIDTLDPVSVGRHDLVFALAIEAHVNDPDRLYDLLGRVTGSTLYFEGNSNCDVPATVQALKHAGFADVTYLGFCDDDIVPANNTRPLLVAQK